MEKQPSSSRELQCVGRLEIARPKPVGFLCGTIPVPTDKAFHDFNASELVPSAERVRAPRYRMIPIETDLNTLPLLSSIPEKVLPLVATHSRTNADLLWESGAHTSNLSRKGEALAVSGLVEYGDEIDVIAPTDILKQIFKIPYSKARLSIAVHRVGKTLVLNTGPDIEEGEKLIRRNNNPPKCADQSLFLNFAMHSVRMEACDCPPTHTPPKEWQCESRESSPESSDHPMQDNTSYEQSGTSLREEQSNPRCTYNELKQADCFWGKKKNRKNKDQGAGKKVSQVKEKSTYSVQESEKYRRASNDGFLRVLFWQFHNFRMLLGSDLLIFSNEKYVAVSLHLWDVSRQVTPLTWLEAWLDNVMASVPELAICYHQDGVVQGYELLKTDDIFLLKGISDDGTPAFHPNVVQQNGLSVLRFLEENCKQDPGAYWLYKSAGEDAIQLFDLSVIPQKRPADEADDNSSSVPSLINRGRSDPLLSLGTILYRIAHRLSLSMSPENKSRCASFFRKCLDFLDEPDHLVVRACAHEQFARLLLTYDEELDLSSEAHPRESEVTGADAEEEPVGSLISVSVADVHDSLVLKVEPDNNIEAFPAIGSDDSVGIVSDEAISSSRAMTAPRGGKTASLEDASNSREKSFAVCDLSKMAPKVLTVADPISTKLAAIHHVSQAIKSLRWKRQMQGNRMDLQNSGKNQDELPSAPSFSLCACGDTDCIEVCDIRKWLPTSKLDNKLWKLVLLLGESYLALGQAYIEDGQLNQTLKVVELACLVYGSMPQHREDSKFVSSIVICSLAEVESDDKSEKAGSSLSDDCFMYNQSSDSYLFWAKAWTLVGDVYAQFYSTDANRRPVQSEQKPLAKELKMSSEVLREVERLKKKLGQSGQNCSSCSLLNCSCQSDRASSGSNASSSSRDARSKNYGRKQNKKSHTKANIHSHSASFVDIHQKGESSTSESKLLMHKKNIARMEISNQLTDISEEKNSGATNSDRDDVGVKMQGISMHKCSESLKEETERESGGIFKYLRGTIAGDADSNLSIALNCYDEARNAMVGHLTTSEDLQSLIKKKGWACNELGRKRLERKELDEAEVAFVDAINAFKEVADHTNIILIHMNLGHGRRALAEEMVAKIENLKQHAILHNAYMQVLQAAKMEYRESLRFYGSAKAVVNNVTEESDLCSCKVRNDVYTQYANTYLRLGMLLSREDTCAEVYENCTLEDSFSRPKVGRRKHEISANDAFREALSVFESLGELRKQETAFACFELACYQRDCCLKFLEQDQKKNGSSKGGNRFLHRVKQYASLAERNWQKSVDYYGPKTHPSMHLVILVEQAALLLNLSNHLHSNMFLESALTYMLEARHVPGDSLSGGDVKICEKYWSHLQMLLKNMLSVSLCPTTNKSSANSQHSASSKSADAGKLRELYKMSLKYTEFTQLQVMHDLWIS
ncbi:putative subtilisin-like protease-like [Capsicum annuum]|uniref:EDRF1 N-terminal domain-containing protein n=2 Tax=Capsicum annuum TaxID=4072 RepID=A0A1U8GUE4_CAPAN|nr:uncharacterized protein LOC107872784 isoform X1 [Capsicum annuum]KAF3661618.1 putative subtilisin-like protease-like [Capsicum annuum]KAF3673712.1 putative subtilisin-like protease-like [Capsicum annuum]PHT79138.1 hypothetical protein T459_17190 [Capsicum annuum]